MYYYTCTYIHEVSALYMNVYIPKRKKTIHNIHIAVINYTIYMNIHVHIHLYILHVNVYVHIHVYMYIHACTFFTSHMYTLTGNGLFPSLSVTYLLSVTHYFKKDEIRFQYCLLAHLQSLGRQVTFKGVTVQQRLLRVDR